MLLQAAAEGKQIQLDQSPVVEPVSKAHSGGHFVQCDPEVKCQGQVFSVSVKDDHLFKHFFLCLSWLLFYALGTMLCWSSSFFVFHWSSCYLMGGGASCQVWFPWVSSNQGGLSINPSLQHTGLVQPAARYVTPTHTHTHGRGVVVGYLVQRRDLGLSVSVMDQAGVSAVLAVAGVCSPPLGCVRAFLLHPQNSAARKKRKEIKTHWQKSWDTWSVRAF